MLGIAWLHDQMHHTPPMMDEELQSLMARRKAQQLETCTTNTDLTIQSWPKELQSHRAEVIRKCASDDD